jgi:hypothetical protein
LELGEVEGKNLCLLSHVTAAALALMVPLGLTGSEGEEMKCPSLVCMPSVNHRQPNFVNVATIIPSCQAGKKGMDDNYRLYLLGKDSTSLSGLRIVAQDNAEDTLFAHSTASESGLEEKINQFCTLVLGQKAMSDFIISDAAPSRKASSMSKYMFTLVNFFKPFGNDATKVATWQKLYRHLCAECGLGESAKLKGPFCMARLFQRCRLMIQSTFPPIPALIDGLTRATAMVYFMSGVGELTHPNLSSNLEFARHGFGKQHVNNLAGPFLASMTSNQNAVGGSMQRMARTIPVTLVSSDSSEFSPSPYRNGQMEQLRKTIVVLSKIFQDQATAASSRSIKEETINALGRLALDLQNEENIHLNTRTTVTRRLVSICFWQAVCT